MSNLTERIMAQIENRSDKERRKDMFRYFKEPIKTYGLKQGTINEVADQFYPEVKVVLPHVFASAETEFHSLI